MEENEIDRILADSVSGESISGKDRRLLEEWKQASGENRCFEREVQELARVGSGLKSRENKALVFERVEQIVERQRRGRLMRGIALVASVVLIVGMSAWFLLLSGERAKSEQQVMMKIMPGSPRAELILPRGEVIQLDTTPKVVPVAGGQAVAKSKRNTLIYDSGEEIAEVEYHTIRVPRGGEYTLQLADNTKVYLNAGSSLCYPVRFTGNQREVLLIGEGYFEVTRDTTKPFIVKVGDVDVRVLGTAFDVSAYPDEEMIATTLVKGCVRVDYGGDRRVMYPGTRLVYDKQSGDVKVDVVDTEVYTSWKDGYYYFKRETLENIMDVLVRWYDLDVFYQNPELKKLEFGGRLRRYGDIDYLLRRMEETQDVEFVINGKAITIKRKTD